MYAPVRRSEDGPAALLSSVTAFLQVFLQSTRAFPWEQRAAWMVRMSSGVGLSMHQIVLSPHSFFSTRMLPT